MLGSQAMIRTRPTACRLSAELTTFTAVQPEGLSDAITRRRPPALEGLFFSSVASAVALQAEPSASQNFTLV